MLYFYAKPSNGSSLPSGSNPNFLCSSVASSLSAALLLSLLTYIVNYHQFLDILGSLSLPGPCTCCVTPPETILYVNPAIHSHAMFSGNSAMISQAPWIRHPTCSHLHSSLSPIIISSSVLHSL